jgi:HEAT repeat protein
MGSDRVSAYSIQEMLCGGDLRSIGRVPEVLGVMEKNPGRMNELVRCLESGDPVVRGRAADALEKLSAKRPGLLKPFKEVLLREAAGSAQQEVRWHMAQMLPRLPLTPRQIPDVFSLLRSYLRDRSVIVQVSALQAMFDLSLKDPSLRGPVREMVEASCRAGAPALRVRGRKLISLLKEEPDGL